MRAYDIAIFTFVFMFVLGMVQQLDLTGASLTMSQSWNETQFSTAYSGLNQSIATADQEVQQASPNYFFESIKLAIQGFRAFATAIISSTIMAPEMLKNILIGLGLTQTEASLVGYPFGIMIWVVYVMGMIQFASGRSTREFQ